jgi:BMFP domain-containing protein YqiC
MINKIAQRLSQEILQSLPLINNLLPKRELELVLQSTLAKLDLVTREEFDAQTAVLQRTRAKVEALEMRCTEIEQQLQKENR